ncbi:MAG TPA: hypothetical protein PK906_12490 [Spirochaetota bacterium]|nr:hypothetical protein [Spirochaetota bacterium]
MSDNRPGNSKKRKFPSLVVLIPSVLVLLFLSWVVYFIIDFGNGFETRIHKGEDARPYMVNFFNGVPLPESAENFYFMGGGFQDPFYEAAMNLPPDDAWSFIARFTGKKKSDFSPLKDKEGFSGEDSEAWNVSEMKSPLICRDKGEESLFLMIYDEETGRFLASYTTW